MRPETKRQKTEELNGFVLLRALATGSFGELLWPLLIGCGALTLALATMGNLGSSALLAGPLLAAGLLATRALVELAYVLDFPTRLGSESSPPLRSADLHTSSH